MKLDDGHEPVVITDQVDRAYIYVLFFERYPPGLFQHRPLLAQSGGIWRWFASPIEAKAHYSAVIGFDRYAFTDPRNYYSSAARGIFVFPGGESLPAPPVLTIRYPDGSIAFNIVVKGRPAT